MDAGIVHLWHLAFVASIATGLAVCILYGALHPCSSIEVHTGRSILEVKAVEPIDERPPKQALFCSWGPVSPSEQSFWIPHAGISVLHAWRAYTVDLESLSVSCLLLIGSERACCCCMLPGAVSSPNRPRI